MRASSLPRIEISVVLAAGLLGLVGGSVILRQVTVGGEAALPIVRGAREACLLCHARVRGIEAAHSPDRLGCASCHLGDRSAREAERAHAGMLLVPGNLATVNQTCGQAECHAPIAARVGISLMATARGIISVDRWVFGEQRGPDTEEVQPRLGRSPADTHLGQLCISCHLGTEKRVPGPTSELSRGGGCVACHLSATPRSSVRRDPAGFVHPGLTLRIRDESCFGCHARSGRISLSYAGWRECREEEASSASRKLLDGRTLCRAEPDVHHVQGMACIDCHTGEELMGDGRVHAHEENATHVRCTTCHRPKGSAAPRQYKPDELTLEARDVVRLRDGKAASAYLVEERSGEPLTNASPRSDGSVEVRGKLDDRIHLARPPGTECAAIPEHASVSCQSCHSTWAPRCVGCHTEFDPAATRIDLSTNRRMDGAWIEADVPPAIAAPTLGILVRHGVRSVEPFVPGMVMTLDPRMGAEVKDAAKSGSTGGVRPHRLYAYAVPHTTTKSARSCRSCHLDSLALGYGAGRLLLVESDLGPGAPPTWRFDPKYEGHPSDGLPADAWVAAFGRGSPGRSSRTTTSSLEPEVQRRVLGVGACLSCHDPEERSGTEIFRRYRESVLRRPASCRVPLSTLRSALPERAPRRAESE